MSDDKLVDSAEAGQVLQAALGHRKPWHWLADNRRGKCPFPVIPFTRAGGRVFYRVADLNKAKRDLETSPLMALPSFKAPKLPSGPVPSHEPRRTVEVLVIDVTRRADIPHDRGKSAWRRIAGLFGKVRRTMH